jgi:methylenetetrahydrofolate reductase (NADPH)
VKTFKQSLQDQDFVVTAELCLGETDGEPEILSQAGSLQDAVCAVQVAEPGFQPGRVSSLAAAAILVRNGIDAVPGISGRERNRIALLSDLLGLRALGITGIVCDASKSESPHLVRDLSRRELISLAGSLNQDESVRPGEEFLIGTRFAIDPAHPDGAMAELTALAAAGARLLQLEPCFDTNLLRKFMQELVEARLTWTYAVMVGLAALPCVEAARQLREQYPDWLIPESVLERLESAADPRAEGIAICCEQIRAARSIPGVAGVRLICLGDPHDAVEAIRASQS